MPLVEFQGEMVDENWLLLYLNKEANEKENAKRAELEAEKRKRDQEIMQQQHLEWERQEKLREARRLESERLQRQNQETYDNVCQIKEMLSTLMNKNKEAAHCPSCGYDY